MTNLTTRYDCTCQEGRMAEEPAGEYVRYDDIKHLLQVEPTKKPADLSYDEFWQKVRETGWNPAPNDLRALLILWESEGGSSQNRTGD